MYNMEINFVESVINTYIKETNCSIKFEISFEIIFEHHCITILVDQFRLKKVFLLFFINNIPIIKKDIFKSEEINPIDYIINICKEFNDTIKMYYLLEESITIINKYECSAEIRLILENNIEISMINKKLTISTYYSYKIF